MPQPLSRVLPNVGGLEIGNVGTRTLTQRPELALMAMEAIATWSHVENFMLRMYVELAGGAGADAAAVYLAMETATAKSAAISVLAARKLTPENQRLLRAIIKLVKTAQKDRDKLAHWVWGLSPDLPDALLLLDPRSLSSSHDQIYVYRSQDFQAMRQRFESLAKHSHLFWFILQNHVANRELQLYERLCQVPEIAEILDRQAQQG